MKKIGFAVPVIALVAGAALGYCLKPSAAPAETKDKSAKTYKAKGVADTPEGLTEKNLRARIKELEAMLAEKNAAAETKEDGKGRNRRGMFGPGGERPSREEMRAQMEKFKKENPEQYAEMEKRRAEFMKQRAERAQSKIDFLSSVDTSTMSKKAQETHAKLQDLIAKRQELEEKMQSMPDLSDDERDSLFSEMRETGRAIQETNSQERENLLQQTAEALGFSGSEATEIVDTISEIYEATSSEGRGGPGGPGGMGGPGMGGPGGRR